MARVTTIQVDRKVAEELRTAKEYPEQTYNSLLQKMISAYRKMKERNQYDEFLHKIQQQKMKELWDNKADEEWENA